MFNWNYQLCDPRRAKFVTLFFLLARMHTTAAAADPGT